MKKTLIQTLAALLILTGAFGVGKAIYRNDQIQKVEQMVFEYNLCRMLVITWTEQGRTFHDNCDESLPEIEAARIKYNVPE